MIGEDPAEVKKFGHHIMKVARTFIWLAVFTRLLGICRQSDISEAYFHSDLCHVRRITDVQYHSKCCRNDAHHPSENAVQAYAVFIESVYPTTHMRLIKMNKFP